MTAPTDPLPDATSPPTHGVLPHFTPVPRRELVSFGTLDLLHELSARLLKAGLPEGEEPVQVGKVLQDLLGRALDVHGNRYSRQRLADYSAYFLRPHRPQARPPLAGATWMELGCGSQNPVAFLFYVLARGAQKGIAIDLDPVPDVPAAMRALADVAAWLLVDPRSITLTDELPAEELLRNLAGFDLSKLRAGSIDGVDSQRLQYRHASVYDLPVAEESVDVVVSNAFLEHVDDAERAVAEIARVTRAGGFSIHVVDGTDHRRYGGAQHPLAFLELDSREPTVMGSNRIRPRAFQSIFARHGFEVLEFESLLAVPVEPAMQRRFAEPFRSMPRADLEDAMGAITVRRR